MMMKEVYVNPKMEMIEFECEDMLLVSGEAVDQGGGAIDQGGGAGEQGGASF
jgi:hypothetical protein